MDKPNDFPATLTTEEVQQTWPSGSELRKWAQANRVNVTVRKGFIELVKSDKPESKLSVADEVAIVANRVVKGL